MNTTKHTPGPTVMADAKNGGVLVCVDHLNFCNEACPDCGLDVDRYGNTEAQFDNCCFPDCGCDGARLCMAPSGASGEALDGNVEGMWSAKTKEQRRAVGRLVARLAKDGDA